MKSAKDGKFPLTVSEGRVTAKIHRVVKIRNGKTCVSCVADYILATAKAPMANRLAAGELFFGAIFLCIQRRFKPGHPF